MLADCCQPCDDQAMLDNEECREGFRARLRQAMEEEGVSNTQLAEAADVTLQAVGGWLKTGKVSRKRLPAIAKAVRRSADWLLTGKGHPKGTKPTPVRRITTYENLDELPEGTHVLIPRVAVDLSAGHGKATWHIEERDPLPFLVDYVKRLGIKPANAVVVKVCGDSMERTLFDDDSVIVNTAETEVRDNGVYALLIDGDLMVKRLFKRPGGGLLVVSDNKDRYPAFEIKPDDLRHIGVIGRVKYRSGAGDF